MHKILSLTLLVAGLAAAQIYLPTPTYILPNAPHTNAGDLEVMDATNTYPVIEAGRDDHSGNIDIGIYSATGPSVVMAQDTGAGGVITTYVAGGGSVANYVTQAGFFTLNAFEVTNGSATQLALLNAGGLIFANSASQSIQLVSNSTAGYAELANGTFVLQTSAAIPQSIVSITKTGAGGAIDLWNASFSGNQMVHIGSDGLGGELITNNTLGSAAVNTLDHTGITTTGTITSMTNYFAGTNAGVNCAAGLPSSSFQVEFGIVIHC
jgi:hypothetical protein